MILGWNQDEKMNWIKKKVNFIYSQKQFKIISHELLFYVIYYLSFNYLNYSL